MRLFKKGDQAMISVEGAWYSIHIEDWDSLLNQSNLFAYLSELVSAHQPTSFNTDLLVETFDPPMGNQEVWAAGVTYLKSKTARMDEAKESGGDFFYNKVYDAARPELFFKASAQRTVGHNDQVHIRHDSTWDVPEPELTLLINETGVIQGYTVGNDMSSRSIEGENPLYLPQAKVFERCASLGPCILVTEAPIPQNSEIQLQIHRNHELMYQDKVTINRMKRSHQELVEYLFKECSFPKGVFLMTGTCLVPPNEFTLRVGDVITITIDYIGTLINRVTQK